MGIDDDGVGTKGKGGPQRKMPIGHDVYSHTSQMMDVRLCLPMLRSAPEIGLLVDSVGVLPWRGRTSSPSGFTDSAVSW